MHIKQKGAGVYIYIADAEGNVITENLPMHPAMVEHPERFRLAEGMPPEDAEALRYSSGMSPAGE